MPRYSPKYINQLKFKTSNTSVFGFTFHASQLCASMLYVPCKVKHVISSLIHKQVTNSTFLVKWSCVHKFKLTNEMQITVKMSHILRFFIFFFLFFQNKAYKQKENQKAIPYPQAWMTHYPQCVNRDTLPGENEKMGQNVLPQTWM